MNRLQTALESGAFTITCELTPPKGTDLSTLIAKAESLQHKICAFNLTDSAAARMTMDPTVAGHTLLQHGIEPIVQVTSRDKNRIAIQSGMLGASALGITNLLIMGGDPPHIGDHPKAKGVNDLFSSEIIAAANALNTGTDHAGNTTTGNTNFFIGSVCNPGAADLNAEIDNTHRKLDAGAQFFQTQAIYQADKLEAFITRLARPDVPLLAGIIPIKSTRMATYMNDRVPGIDIPAPLIKQITTAEAISSEALLTQSLTIATNTINQIQPMCNGIHLMAIGWEKHLPTLLTQTKLSG